MPSSRTAQRSVGLAGGGASNHHIGSFATSNFLQMDLGFSSSVWVVHNLFITNGSKMSTESAPPMESDTRCMASATNSQRSNVKLRFKPYLGLLEPPQKRWKNHEKSFENEHQQPKLVFNQVGGAILNFVSEFCFWEVVLFQVYRIAHSHSEKVSWKEPSSIPNQTQLTLQSLLIAGRSITFLAKLQEMKGGTKWQSS